MHLLYPSDFQNPKLPDEVYRAEAEAFAAKGVTYSCINTFESISANKPKLTLPPGELILYRGWMQSTQEYQNLVAAIQSAGCVPFTDANTYLLTHHIPNWYPLLRDLTAETVVFPNGSDFAEGLHSLGWDAFFVKDFVKSLKTSVGSVIRDPSQINVLVQEMQKYRGMIEGGLCVRRVESFIPKSETRYFVIRGVPHAPEDQTIPLEVQECAKRINSQFFSVDIALRSDGVLRVVEIGDGQVSDHVGWSLDRFVEICCEHL